MVIVKKIGKYGVSEERGRTSRIGGPAVGNRASRVGRILIKV